MPRKKKVFNCNILSSNFIGKKIKQKRIEIGFTQEELAEKIGITYQQVQRYEYGTNILNVEQIQNLALIMKVPVIFFFEGNTGQNLVKDNVDECSYQPINIEEKEEKKVLKYFRKIKSSKSRKLFLELVKLAVNSEKM